MKSKDVQVLSALTPALLLGLLTATTTWAGLTKLAETGDAEPNGTNTFFQIDQTPVLSDNGQVAFYTDLRNNGFLQGWGIFLADGQRITTVARSGEPSPDLNGNFYTFNSLAGLNSTSQVFQVGLTGTLGGSADNSAIYQLHAGVLTLLARTGQTVPGGGATFWSFDRETVRINRAGQVAFRCSTSSGAEFIYRVTDGTLAKLAYSGQPAPDGNGTLFGFLGEPTLNNAGKVAFSSITVAPAGSYGLFLADDSGLKVLARSGQAVPDGNGQFINFPAVNLALNDNDQVAFVAYLTGTTAGAADNRGLYRADPAGIQELVRKGQLVPDGNGRILDFGLQYQVAINNAGTVAFSADLTGTTGGSTDNAGIYLATGTGLKQVVRKGQHAPDGNGVFSGFQYPTLNNSGELAFVATLAGTSGGSTDNQGIFFVDSSLAVKQVIRAGQVVGGKTVSSPNFLDGPNFGGLSGLNDNGQLAVWSYLNGNAAVFLWSNSDVLSGLRLTKVARIADDEIVTFEALGGTTNFVQAASNPNGTFADIGRVIVTGSGLVATNLTELGGATNKARFYRIRQPQ